MLSDKRGMPGAAHNRLHLVNLSLLRLVEYGAVSLAECSPRLFEGRTQITKFPLKLSLCSYSNL
ncbi:hypothetical protein ACTXT7_002551 [Hymenolepis weldensis]